MNNFEFISPTKIIFGKDEENRIGEILKKEGYQKILLHYGQRSIFKIGLYDKVVKSLQDNNISYIELGGVEPNPKIDLVRKGLVITQELLNSLPAALIVRITPTGKVVCGIFS